MEVNGGGGRNKGERSICEVRGRKKTKDRFTFTCSIRKLGQVFLPSPFLTKRTNQPSTPKSIDIPKTGVLPHLTSKQINLPVHLQHLCVGGDLRQVFFSSPN